MRSKIYFLLALLFAAVTVAAQTTATRILTANEYDLLKKSNQLPDKFLMKKTEGSQEVLVPRIHPSASNVQSNAVCNCLLPLDNTYSVVPFNSGVAPDYRNDDGSSPAITLPFSFCFFGQPMNSIYINNNGDVSFGSPYFTFISDSFPNTTYAMLAALWADVDTRNPLSGLVYYKVTPTAAIIKWEHVGYFPNAGDKLNTFQLIITDGTDPLVSNGNVAFCYGDMQWTSGGIGFGAPATAGANLGDGTNYVQFGRFNQAGYAYDGPFGANDGIDWLDNSNFIFDLCISNTPPVPYDCNADTAYLRVGDIYNVDVSFIDPDPGQSASINVNTNGLVNLTTVSNTNGNLARYQGTLVADASNLGFNTLTLTATDNGTSAQSTTYNRVIHIDQVTGIQNHSSSASISFSPNPFREQTTLTISGMHEKNISMVISDVTGREVMNVEHVPSTLTIEKGNLSKGVYMYHLTDGKSLNETGKLVIQ